MMVVLALVCLWVLVFATSSGGSAGCSSSALEIPPSQYFEGNDGPWSSFDLRVGTPSQYVRVLVSTAAPESMVVLSGYGCSTSFFPMGVPSDCAASRGNLFKANQSSTWHKLGLYGINGDGVGLEANLGYSVRAQFALDTLGPGLTGLRLENQTVAGIASPEPFYLGIFGLNPQPVNFTTLGNFSSPSFVTTLKNQCAIPSLSWSYTAGAKYRLKQVYGQLIFSGYDTSRFTPNSVSFTMAGDITRDLVVYLQSIDYSGPSSSTLLSNPILIFIDSTDPNLWLPGSVCDAFEQAFGLTLDSQTGLYLMDEAQNTKLRNDNPQVSFKLANTPGGATVTVTLPYAAFALTAAPPLVSSTSYYFPLKRAANSTQYTLGRTFLQEAYLSADYERGVFNVSACAWNEGAQQNIVTIEPKGSGSSTSSGTGTGSSGSSSSLSRGAVAGITVAAVVGTIILAALIWFCIRRQRQKSAYKATPPQSDPSVLTGPVHNAGIPAAEGFFYSPDTAFNGLSGSNIGVSSGSGNQPDSSVTERGMELDGDDTEIKPIYHELPNNEVGVAAVRGVPTSSLTEDSKVAEKEPSESSPITMAV